MFDMFISVTITLVQPTEAGIVLASSAELNCEADVLAIVKWPPNCFVGTSTQGNPVTCIATVCGIRVQLHLHKDIHSQT